jgi:hypothetical protein
LRVRCFSASQGAGRSRKMALALGDLPVLGSPNRNPFHEQRAAKVQKELRDHGLDGIVEATHRDVYEDGSVPGYPLKTARAEACVNEPLPAPASMTVLPGRALEFHEQRAAKVQKELRDHGLDGIVEATHRDVYEVAGCA